MKDEIKKMIVIIFNILFGILFLIFIVAGIIFKLKNVQAQYLTHPLSMILHLIFAYNCLKKAHTMMYIKENPEDQPKSNFDEEYVEKCLECGKDMKQGENKCEACGWSYS